MPPAPAAGVSPELTPLSGTSTAGHVVRASSPVSERAGTRQDGGWRHSSRSYSSARGSDKQHRISTEGEMRCQDRAPFTTLKALATHSSKDALKCPVGNSTGCSPPPSRAVTASLPDLRTASAANRRECDSNGIADGAVSDQVVAGQDGHRPPSSKAYVFDST